MTQKAILFLGPAELAGTVREHPDLIVKCELIALTPDVYELSKKNVPLKLKYPDWVQQIRTFSIEDQRRIESILIDLESSSSEARQSFFGTINSRVDWNYQSNYFLLTLMMSVKSFAKQAQIYLMRYEHLYIASLGHSSEFYFDSGLYSSLLCHELKKHGINPHLIVLDERSKATTYQPDLYERMPDLLSATFASHWKNQISKVLIATSAIYSNSDRLKLGHMLRHSYPHAYRYVYPIPLWPAIKPSSEFDKIISVTEVLFKMPKTVRERCIDYVDWLTDRTTSTFIECVNDQTISLNEMFVQQMLRLKKRHLFQILTFCNVYNLCRLAKPEMMAITVQDSGINGPLASAANLQGVPLYQFPHSHVINWRAPCDCKVVTEWWQPVAAKTLWNESVSTIFVNTNNNEANIPSAVKKTKWVFLYNGTQENLSTSVAWPFIKSVVKIVDQKSKAIGCQLVHRLKPGDQTPITTFCEILNLEQDSVARTLSQPLPELLNETTLVISVDEPSSALWEALEWGCGVILVADRELTLESLCDGDILSPIGIDEFRQFMKEVLSDSSRLERYIESQQLKFKKKHQTTISHLSS